MSAVDLSSPLLRVPPHVPPAERAIVAACVWDASVIDSVREHVAPEDFYIEALRVAFRAQLRMRAAGEPVDVVTMAATLRALDAHEVAYFGVDGPIAYLAQILGEFDAPNRYNAIEYAKIVRGRAILRRALGLAMEVVTAVHGEVEDAAALASAAASRFAEVAAHGSGSGGLVTLGTAAAEVLANAETAHRSGGRAPGMLTTGFNALDDLLGGWHPGHFIAIGGVPGTGKSAFMLSSLRAATRQSGTWALVVSEEMDATEVAERAVASESEVNSMVLRSGRLRSHDWGRLDGAVRRIQSDRILFAPPGTTTVDKLMVVWRKAKAQVERMGERMGVIAVDYLQLFQPTNGRRSGNRVEELTEITRALKCMFMVERVPGLVLSSFNRGGANRPDARPVMSDFRGSGSIESDANVAIGLYSEWSASAGRAQTASSEAVEAHILKARNGRLGMVPLPFVREAAAFRTDAPMEVESWHDRG